MREQTSRVFTTVAVLAVGYCVGMARGPEPTYAQSAEPVATPNTDFVVVAGHTSSSSNARHYYYVVAADGKATKVLIDGDPVYAPKKSFPTKLQLKHDLPSNRIRLDHSGRVSQ